VAATPAFAAPSLTVELSPGSFDMKGGDTRSMTVKLTNSGPLARVTLTATAPTGLGGDVTLASSDSACSGSGSTVTCTVDIVGDAQKNVVLTLAAKNPDSLGAGQSRTDTSGAVTATMGLGSTKLAYAVTLHGPPQAQASSAPASSGAARTSTGSATKGVSEVSGTVVDSGTSQPVPGATVVLLDGAGQALQATTDSSGGFVFASSSSQQIAPGTLTLTASRDLYQAATSQTVQAKAGQSYSGIRLPLTPVAGDPSASESPGYGSSPHRTASGGTWTWLLIGSGILLVLAGGGILAVLVVRRRAKPEPWSPEPVSAADPWARR
jgi:hypothetical protein